MVRKRHEEVRADSEVTPLEHAGEREMLIALRPQRFAEYVGQREVVDNLRVAVAAAPGRSAVVRTFRLRL